MGKIVQKVNSQKKFTKFIVTGKITADEIIKAINTFYDGDVTPNII